MVGSTGTVDALELVHSAYKESYQRALRQPLTPDHLDQVRMVKLDRPGRAVGP